MQILNTWRHCCLIQSLHGSWVQRASRVQDLLQILLLLELLHRDVGCRARDRRGLAVPDHLGLGACLRRESGGILRSSGVRGATEDVSTFLCKPLQILCNLLARRQRLHLRPLLPLLLLLQPLGVQQLQAHVLSPLRLRDFLPAFEAFLSFTLV